MSERRTDGRIDVRSRPVRPPAPARSGPLVAAADPARARRRTPPPEGPLRGFVRRYGWRAYAIPLLTLATLFALVDVVVNEPTVTQAAGTSSEVTASTPSVLPLPETGLPADAPARGDAQPSELAERADAATYVEKGAGTVSVVDGGSPVYGTGPLRRFVVEVEDGIDVDGEGFAEAVQETLGDPRSWGNGGRMSFQRVGAAEAAAGEYEFKVTLVSPGNMETYCPGVGTGGYTSCRYGERAVINLARWATAVPDYEGDIATYRLYVVDHEVGHALGNGHEPCPGAGKPAPVMQQQTLGLKGCTKNAWPYP